MLLQKRWSELAEEQKNDNEIDLLIKIKQ